MKAALAQVTSTADRTANIAAAREMCLEAARGAADLVAFPENVLYLRSEGMPVPDPLALDGPVLAEFRAIAKARRIWILLGSVPEAASPPKIHNTSVLIDRTGEIRASYRKIHLFDVAIPGGPNLRESDAVIAGDRAVTVETEFGVCGMSICYDLRFPELYRRLSRAGARILFAPSAFTEVTGRDHWELLCRARAVESQCWLIAPAQWGRHSPTRASWGHSMVVDPWGRIVAEKPDGIGLLWADLDLTEVDRVRSALPSLANSTLWLNDE
jgi:predicted amidohydrolase